MHVSIGVGFGLVSLIRLATHFPNGQGDEGWPEIDGLGITITLNILGGALSFLLELSRDCANFFDTIVYSLAGTAVGGRPEGVNRDDSHKAHKQCEAGGAWLGVVYGKIKTTPLPLPLHLLVHLLKSAYTGVIFSQIMAYSWVMKLTQHELRQRILLKRWGFILVFACTTALGIVFLEALHLIAQQLDDPYGSDISDLPLPRIAKALRSDLVEIVSVSKPPPDEHKDVPLKHHAFAPTSPKTPKKHGAIAAVAPTPAQLCDAPAYAPRPGDAPEGMPRATDISAV
ncbi:hypothetical protein M885DRAFT_561054 [Pelagophyceae sp. CCMP2097]|nr:hypothetical protein M885DRAFT_561054 [Pelagophyceae sp. CCMP2097]